MLALNAFFPARLISHQFAADYAQQSIAPRNTLIRQARELGNNLVRAHLSLIQQDTSKGRFIMSLEVNMNTRTKQPRPKYTKII